MTHGEIAKHISSNFSHMNGWWVQTVTVGYERIRGLRDVGQKRGGQYEANKSRTFPVDPSTLYQRFADVKQREKWLPGGIAKVRTAIPDKSIRADWKDGTRIDLSFTPKTPKKTTITVQHQRLPTRKAVEKMKLYWHERFDVLQEILS